jgi:hypothetical protein
LQHTSINRRKTTSGIFFLFAKIYSTTAEERRLQRKANCRLRDTEIIVVVVEGLCNGRFFDCSSPWVLIVAPLYINGFFAGPALLYTTELQPSTPLSSNSAIATRWIARIRQG